MFFEQNQLEAHIGAARFLVMTGRAPRYQAYADAAVARGRASLESLARGLADGRPFLAGDDYTVADIAVYAYTHCAGDVGADPRERPEIAGWLDRVEATDAFVNDLAPFPEHALVSA